jgi:hypothetical protein
VFAVLVLGSGSPASAQNVSCTCRYQGQDFGLGDSICLKSADGLRMATCEMVLNNTSWKMSNAPCPVTQWNRHDAPRPANSPMSPIRSGTGFL